MLPGCVPYCPSLCGDIFLLLFDDFCFCLYFLLLLLFFYFTFNFPFDIIVFDSVLSLLILFLDTTVPVNFFYFFLFFVVSSTFCCCRHCF